MKSVISLVSAVVLFSGVNAFASGFDCTEAGGFAVKLRNHVHKESGTNNPAVLVISSEGEGVLLVREGDAIRKHVRSNSTQYVVEGNRKIDADTVIFQLPFKEGANVLENGEAVDGQLILVKDDEKTVRTVNCFRYLKP